MKNFIRFLKRPPKESIIPSPCASLCILGEYLNQSGFFKPFYDQINIFQKEHTHNPVDKLLEVLLCCLRGSPTVYEINTLVRPYPELWQAFGLNSCAEQSTVSDPLNACTQENVDQFRQVINQVFQQESLIRSHNWDKEILILELDLFGLTTGATSENASKGYFPRKRNRFGHQLVRVMSPQYNEVIGEWLFPGNTTSSTVLKEIVLEVEKILNLTPDHYPKVLWRLDAGFGTDKNINWLLWRKYQLLTKGFSGKRAPKLAKTVREWIPAPSENKNTGREVGKITEPIRYGRRTYQWSVRVPKKKGGYKYATLIATDDLHGIELVKKYDNRAGMENRTMTDMKGLGLGKRKKKHWPAQQIMILIVQLAHNLLIWNNAWFESNLTKTRDKIILKEHGVYRIVNQRLNINGLLHRMGKKVTKIELNPLHPFSDIMKSGFQPLLTPFGITIILGKT